ncbi:MAG TPA: hypothetical protein VK438_14895 [Xanthobacteraceae bacterium]|nr:hypothetical protein [Xanthobacteraceae bacterium]
MIGFPLLLIPFAIYNMIAFLTPGVSWTSPVYTGTLPLRSGATWMGTIGDAFLVFTLLMLMCEFIKSSRQGKSFVEHFLSLLLAGGAAAEFWMVREGANSTFFLFVVICFVDMFAGFAASLRRARRRVVVEQPAPVLRAEPPAARVEPTRVDSTRVESTRVEPVPTEPQPNPFTRVEPTAAPEPSGRTEPVVKIGPAQRVGS